MRTMLIVLFFLSCLCDSILFLAAERPEDADLNGQDIQQQLEEDKTKFVTAFLKVVSTQNKGDSVTVHDFSVAMDAADQTGCPGVFAQAVLLLVNDPAIDIADPEQVKGKIGPFFDQCLKEKLARLTQCPGVGPQKAGHRAQKKVEIDGEFWGEMVKSGAAWAYPNNDLREGEVRKMAGAD